MVGKEQGRSPPRALTFGNTINVYMLPNGNIFDSKHPSLHFLFTHAS